MSIQRSVKCDRALTRLLELTKLIEAGHLDFPPTDLIFLVDALDVWIQLSPANLARRFVEYGHDVVVGAERHCIPNQWSSVSDWETLKLPLSHHRGGMSGRPEEPPSGGLVDAAHSVSVQGRSVCSRASDLSQR